jgi:ribosomal protein L11 methyltransferase
MRNFGIDMTDPTNLTQFKTPMSREQAFALVDAVMEREDLALTATAYEDADDEWVFEATCDAEPDMEAFNALARDVLGGTVSFAAEKIDTSTDWVSKSLEGLQPVHAGGFFVYGGHFEGKLPHGATAIHIEAAQAFGTGHHETTTGCLEAIDMELKKRRPSHMLDIGTGTGVLAIGLAKRTNLPLIASDIDPVAVEVTRNNARLNGVPNQVVAIEAVGIDDPEIRGNAPYDLIVANILAGPLSALAKDISTITKPGAAIILSGLLDRQAPRVLSAYRQHDMMLEKKIVKKDWATLILRQAGPQS